MSSFVISIYQGQCLIVNGLTQGFKECGAGAQAAVRAGVSDLWLMSQMWLF